MQCSTLRHRFFFCSDSASNWYTSLFENMTVKSEVAWFKGGVERNCPILGGDETEESRKMGPIC